MISRLPEDAQTLYAETLAVLLALEGEREWSHLSGTFTTKRTKGHEYVYFQYSDPGGAKRQFSVGRRTAELEATIARYAEGRARIADDLAELRRLAGMMRAAGLAVYAHAPARVLRALVDAGVFRVGGVLVGSYAFLALGNMLGVTWPGAAWRTRDLDIAAHMQLAVQTQDVDVPKVLDSLSMGFVPVPQLDPRHPSTSFSIRGKELRLDLLTPGTDRDRAPIFVPRLAAAAAPIKHLSLVMQDAQPAVVTDGTTASLVVVPTPARFALHKTLVSQARSSAHQAKGGKDLHQAALLLEVLAEDRPDDLVGAAEVFSRSGPAVSKRVGRGLRALARRWPGSEPGVSLLIPLLE